ncbi:DUF2690 domain-containing protein [Streptomyces sp. NPDC021354]|uniref:helix-turn-helix domain-containing protein n=1 Tax=Streptomyces sp. NPDC021354 TaxID=3154793 RepID=UPI0033F1C335
MARWRPLPGDLPPRARRLVEELRLHKDRSRLSLTSLAAKTAYSSSSWHRYLNGRALPPWEAVDALGRLTRADRGLLRVLWESASDAWTAGQGAQTEQSAQTVRTAGEPREPEGAQGSDRGPSTPARPRRPSRRTAVGAAVAVCGLLAAFLALLVIRPWGDGVRPRSAPPGAPEGSPAWPWELRSQGTGPTGTHCAARSCQGRDPYRDGCDRDSVTVHALSAHGRTLRLRYSPVCRAVWAEVDPADGTGQLLAAAAGATTQTAARGAAHTAMVAADQHKARACVVVAGQQLGVTEHDSWIGPVGAVSGDGTGRG